MCNDISDWAYCADPEREAMDYEENARFDGWGDPDPYAYDDHCPDCGELDACYCVPIAPYVPEETVFEDYPKCDDKVPF